MMVQVQSTWFTLTEHNPQKFMNIFRAAKSDFEKATQCVDRSSSLPSRFVPGGWGSRLTRPAGSMRIEPRAAVVGAGGASRGTRRGDEQTVEFFCRQHDRAGGGHRHAFLRRGR